ncbi:ubiquitin-like-conjugating enzyme ATG10 isoform X1 [Entelurus aequoreus]|uniref:ubiquitin-like-conjugating enzyme ATG10 n=2 Tax=Entelurus aequoreus TaxID=161455 RepID=UPI002B1E1C07|nr:ubiquitin-like-conjugating enzyme ATG10 [Entelurus aequoreus]XP_061925664.1 ubiquitin-like-conjugating enzyme ATG10 isoform X1 [Entelurus aequoreus]
MSSGLQSEEDFRHLCQVLLKTSDRLRDGWSWERVQGSEEGYLKKTALRSVLIQSGDQDLRGSGSDSEDVAAGDDADTAAASEGSTRALQYEYHILYSCSFMTPVLYFRASTLEGRSLSLEEVWSSVHPHFRSRLRHSPLTSITQQEHPVLGQPFFMLHPCKTDHLMSALMHSAQQQHRPVNYMVTWLSTVGPLLGLEVPLEYLTLQHPSTPRQRP